MWCCVVWEVEEVDKVNKEAGGSRGCGQVTVTK